MLIDSRRTFCANEGEKYSRKRFPAWNFDAARSGAGRNGRKIVLAMFFAPLSSLFLFFSFSFFFFFGIWGFEPHPPNPRFRSVPFSNGGNTSRIKIFLVKCLGVFVARLKTVDCCRETLSSPTLSEEVKISQYENLVLDTRSCDENVTNVSIFFVNVSHLKERCAMEIFRSVSFKARYKRSLYHYQNVFIYYFLLSSIDGVSNVTRRA